MFTVLLYAEVSEKALRNLLYKYCKLAQYNYTRPAQQTSYVDVATLREEYWTTAPTVAFLPFSFLGVKNRFQG
jgi:hypothetical protein